MAILNDGIDIKNKELVKRSEVVAFAGIEVGLDATAYVRAKGFTEFATNKNPTEYSRKYVDEDSERTSLTGYATSISYAFDKYKGNRLLEKLAQIADMELLGDEATIPILMVDLSSITQSSEGEYTALAYLRDFSVIPSTSGDSTDCMTYSGDLKVCGEIERVTAVGSSSRPEKWLQCTIRRSSDTTESTASEE